MMTFFKVMQFVTVGFGFVCAAFPFILFWHFSYSKKPIGKAVAYMLLGESVGIFMTVMFSVFAEGVVDVVEPWHAMVMRWIMFGTAFITSIHLALRTWQIETSAGD